MAGRQHPPGQEGGGGMREEEGRSRCGSSRTRSSSPVYEKAFSLSLSSLSSLPSNTNVRSLASVNKSVNQSINPSSPSMRPGGRRLSGSCLDAICMASVSAVIPCMRSFVARELQRACDRGCGGLHLNRRHHLKSRHTKQVEALGQTGSVLLTQPRLLH